MIISQGDVWWVDPTPKMGSEQRGKRPALVIQNDIANRYLKTTIIAMISKSGKKGMLEMVELDEADGLKNSSFADFAQIFTIDKSRLTEKIGKIHIAKWRLAENALAAIFLKTIGKELN